MSVKENPIRWYALERVLAAVAVAVCLTVTGIVWQSVSQQQAMWPMPGLYFLEVIGASLLGLWGIFRADQAGGLLTWAVVGLLVGFAILGALSVGFFYLPVTGLLGLAALWQDRHAWRRLPLHLGVALLAALAQVALMLALVQVLNPSATF